MIPTENPKKFIVVTQDFSGLGFAKRLTEEGNDVLVAIIPKEDEDNEELLMRVGDGIVEKQEISKVIKNRLNYKDAYWIWDQNHNFEYADQLRKEGFKVFGGQELAYKMEHDRKFGNDIIKKAGLDTLPTHEFSDIQSGLDFLDANEDKAFVFKPDESVAAYTTYVPDNEIDEYANRELYRYMESLSDDGTYILQERISDALETNVEVWLYKGTPFFAFVDLESKRKLNKDEGEMVGCAHDIVFTTSLESRLVKETIAKLYPFYQDYTGFLDMNVLIKDKKFYFLEFCARFGYNSHPNLFWNLALSPIGEILSDFIDGKIEDFYRHFNYGFGASVTLYIDHPREGLPFKKQEHFHGHFYHFDTYENEDDEYFLAGYANEVGIVMGYGYTIEEAGRDALRNGDKIFYPMHAMRTDICGREYNSSPANRYDALEAMKLLCD